MLECHLKRVHVLSFNCWDNMQMMFENYVMFDAILSGCDGIRQYPSKWLGGQCEVMRIPDMEVASCVQTIHTILVVNAGHVPH